MLNLPDIATRFRIVAMFVINDICKIVRTEFAVVFIIYFNIIPHTLSFKGSLVTVNKQKRSHISRGRHVNKDKNYHNKSIILYKHLLPQKFSGP